MRGKTAKALRGLAERLCHIDGTPVETGYNRAWKPRKGEPDWRVPTVLSNCARQKYQAMKAAHIGSKSR